MACARLKVQLGRLCHVPCSELCGCFERVSRLCSHRRAQRLQPDRARWERAALQGTQPGLAGCTDAWRLQVRRQLRSLGGPARQRRRSMSTGAVNTRRAVAPGRVRREGGPAHRERRSGSSTRWVAAGACTATRARGAWCCAGAGRRRGRHHICGRASAPALLPRGCETASLQPHCYPELSDGVRKEQRWAWQSPQSGAVLRREASSRVARLCYVLCTMYCGQPGSADAQPNTAHAQVWR